MPTIKKLLIANRGEIALRIIRTARAMGLRTAAVYSEADALSAHVAAADEALLIGPAPAAQSYLNLDAILSAARACGADAVHPGYGFLSENAAFARAVEHSALLFIGPPAAVMEQVGDKVAARILARRIGVPVVPGRETASVPDASEFARQAGYPILIKAAAGGGGRGMRIVAGPGELEAALIASAREALAAFGNGRLFVEKYLAHPRHIEVQILGDGAGQVVTLGERDCSIQRRHQKIIEEAPAPEFSPLLRQQLLAAALKIATTVAYRSAGTVEFLVDGPNFYFLEVNARLQVEHPVTELCFDRDLVELQIRLANGEPLAEPPAPRGHAIECRIYAEDARNDFRPAAGRVLQLRLPAGPGVRIDTFLEPGAEITSFYDGLLAKLVCHGADREQARRRMVQALDDFMLTGVCHTAAFLRDVMASEAFTRARLATDFLRPFMAQHGPDQTALQAALLLAAAQLQGGGRAAAEPTQRLGATPIDSPFSGLGAFNLWRRK